MLHTRMSFHTIIDPRRVNMSGTIRVKTYGTRGSLPSPRIATDISAKNIGLLEKFKREVLKDPSADVSVEEFLRNQPFHETATYGGNTSCVEVMPGEERFIFDMGSGARILGMDLMREIFAKGGVGAAILLSHTHWDHIQGFPFFGPAFVNKEDFKIRSGGVKNFFTFYGGTSYLEDIEVCLQQQMQPRVFPVSWEWIKHINYNELPTHTIGDMERFSIGDVQVFARLLPHPGGSLGYRLSYKDKVIAYTTDNEPFAPETPYPPLVELATNADIWITDCQYLWEIYTGEVGGLCRMGWGHSYPVAVAVTAIKAGVKHIVLFHHDPASSDERIADIANLVRQELSMRNADHIQVTAAYDGMEMFL